MPLDNAPATESLAIDASADGTSDMLAAVRPIPSLVIAYMPTKTGTLPIPVPMSWASFSVQGGGRSGLLY